MLQAILKSKKRFICAGVAVIFSSHAFAALEEILVTANKRSESLNDVGISVSAISGNQLAEQKLTSLADIASAVPGLVFSPSTANTPIFTLRGVGFNESSLGVYPATSIYIDEAPLPFPVLASHVAYDLAQVEVLKGPQGTLFGQNATAGAINFIANKPTDTFEAGGDLSYGRFNKIEVNGYVSGPLSDGVGARLAMTGVKSDGWQKSISRDAENGEEDYLAARLLFDFHPSDTLSIKVNLNGWKDKSDPQAQQLAGVAPNIPSEASAALLTTPFVREEPRAADWSPSIEPKGDRQFFQGVFRADIELGNDMMLTSLSSYSDFKQDQVVDGDGSALILFDLEQAKGDIDSFSTELRLTSSAVEDFRWIVGANYENSNTFENQVLRYTDNSNNNAANAFINSSGVTLDQAIENYAFFANGDMDVIPDLTLKAGVRYTDTSVEADHCAYGSGDGQLAVLFNILGTLDFINTERVPFEPVGGFPDCVTLNYDGVPGDRFQDILDEDNVAWRLGLDYRVSDQSLVYFNISEGYKTGSYPTLAAAIFEAVEPVTQESVLAYEFGVKSTLADGSVQLNAAAFYYDYKDKQLRGKLVDPVFGLLDKLVNVPESEVLGVEVDVVVQVTGNLTLSAALTYLDSEVNEYVGVNILGVNESHEGDPIPFTPDITYNLDVDYRIPIKSGGEVFAGASVRGQSESDAAIGAQRLSYPDTPENRSNQKYPYNIDSYSVIDLRLGYESANQNWKVMLWGRNVTDEYYWTSVIPSSDDLARFAGQPATYGITVGYKYY